MMRTVMDDHAYRQTLYSRFKLPVIGVQRHQLDLSRELNVIRNRVWKILRFTLRKCAYNIQVLHHLDYEDFACRRAMVVLNPVNPFRHLVKKFIHSSDAM
ncbi:hypothetical protein ANN_03179 [Periplaneta americana]|uniref:Uncharacterized protein n=1 Tax=Periplaneta americana TaxID=6978 RepID=A0ABQ8TYB1_PERAM|nr:hypothetical protein ANN_03179 [Periplaneta americana]